MRKDDSSSVSLQCQLHHLPRKHRSLSQRATEQLFSGEDPVLSIQEDHHKHFMLPAIEQKLEVIPHQEGGTQCVSPAQLLPHPSFHEFHGHRNLCMRFGIILCSAEHFSQRPFTNLPG